MLKFLLQRLATLVPTLFFVSVLIFGLQQLLPGDPAIALAGEERDPETIRYLRAKFHLDEPLPVRYWYWASGVLQGDLGESVRIQKPVTELILEKLPVTIQLAAMAMVIALVIGITAGVISAVKKDTWWDYGANVFALWGLSTPNFWLGILLILLFAVELGWLPASGYVSPFEDLKGNLAAMIMPAFVLGNAIAAVLMRHTRSAMLQVLSSDYVRTARAKGLDERVVILKHALRNALIPIITLGALGIRHPALRRRAHRAGLLHPRLRQADRRCRVQPRLLRGAGRGALHGDGVRHAQPSRRPRLLPRESEVEGLMAAVVFEQIQTAPGRRALRRLARRGGAMFGFAVVVFFVLLALLAPWIAPYDPVATNWGAIRGAPSAAHWFGGDELGRDVLSRIVWGARASILAGVVSVTISLSLGVPIGMLAGYMGRWVDALISRITDAMLACPFLILAIALAAFLGPSLTNAMIAIGISATPVFIRLTRAQVLNAKAEDYVEAARALGNPHYRIVLRHILPNIVAPLIVQATLAIAAAVIAEASLSFLGLGQQPPAPSWGSMLNTARNYVDQAPWMAIWPGVSIFLLVLSFNLLGDGLRDALDPRHK